MSLNFISFGYDQQLYMNIEMSILQDKVHNWLKPTLDVLELVDFYQGIGIFCINVGIIAFNSTFYSQTAVI